jgi:alkanesulfonate monooxygenase SsuD/methylene tetrahydromethanopterin reductase-like flavin-dependent oxidoreductase (luciferase family)
MTFKLLRRGQLIAVPSVERALKFIEEERRANLAQHSAPRERDRRRIVGSPATVRAGVEAAVREYNADEAMIVSITHEHETRRRSYELIAQAFGLIG